MADDRESQSREDLTEEASQYRLEEFRSKGMVSQSKELSGLLVLLTVAVMMYSMAPRFGQEIAEFMKEVLRTDLSSRVDLGNTQVMGQYLMKALKMILLMGFPICGAGFLLGILASFAQVGAVFSFDPLTPDFSKIDPLSG
ncbi:MAG: EscU/YscU/HrcU family type III secretion system export apparatus switch protein, partial [Bdellovibrionia bacterium]